MKAALGVGAALGALAVTVAYRRDMRAAYGRLAGASRLVDTPHGVIEVAEEGAGRTVLAIHGAAGGFDMGLSLARSVLRDGYRIVAPSRFGYLGTPLPTREHASHADQADALADLLDALGEPSAIVLAASAGAQSATQLALRHPEKVAALVLITPALYLPPDPSVPLETGPPSFVFDRLLASDFLAWAALRAYPNFIVRVAGVPPSLDAQVTPELRKKLADWFFPAKPRHVGIGHDMAITTPVAPDLPIEDLWMPVLMISAADDPYRTDEVIEYSLGRIPTAKAVILESGGHILLGQEQRVRAEVATFLDAVRQ